VLGKLAACVRKTRSGHILSRLSSLLHLVESLAIVNGASLSSDLFREQ
jgi:hypothetical protein